MKLFVNIARILVGLLFIFSGLVKAIDPLGLSYKMQEFFEAWAADGYLKGLMDWMHGHSLMISIFMITLEVLLGIALLLGAWKRLTVWLLLLLMLFFTFLTSYVLFSGKIRACGCFGDCIPLTPVQTFTKDIILLVLVMLIVLKQEYIKPIFRKLISNLLLVCGILAVCYLQWHVLRHLPVKDCLPYKVGNDLLKLRQMPPDAIPDKYAYVFIYEKDGVKKEFTSGFPDSTWKYVDRKQTLVEKGKNNVPLINDFSFTTSGGNDTTEAILSQNGLYYLLLCLDFDHVNEWLPSFRDFYDNSKRDKKIPVYIITSQSEKARAVFGDTRVFGQSGLPVFTCDGTAIKTAARATPTMFLMSGPVVKNKWSWADFDAIFK